MLRAAASVLAGLALSSCVADELDEPLGSTSQRIVRGQVTTGSPATVFLAMELSNGFGVCSGTLISPRVVLTARHCLRDEDNGEQALDPANIQVMFGSNASAEGNRWIAVTDTDFRSDADLGILTLAEPGPATPIRVFGGTFGRLEDRMGTTVHLVGFGITVDKGADSGTKREGYTQLARLDRNDYGFVMITGYDKDGAWTCNGDSGGPNFIDIGGQEVIAGVTSYGTSKCGTPEDGAVRTDRYYAWIMDYVAAVDGLPDAGCGVDALCAEGCATPDPDCVEPVSNVIGTGPVACRAAAGGRAGGGLLGLGLLGLGVLGLVRRRRRG
jgi:MYXO-CTERM domain-containing protein